MEWKNDDGKDDGGEEMSIATTRWSIFTALLLILPTLMMAQGSTAQLNVSNLLTENLPILDSYPSNYPHAPENITTMPGPNYIDISWEPTKYDGGSPVIAVYIYDVGWDDDTTPIVKLGPAARSYRVNGLNPGQSYTFFMRSENANGIGWWGSSDWATPGRTVPSAPTSFRLSAGQTQANLSWEPPSIDGGKMVEGYRVYGGLNANNLTQIGTVYEYTRNFVALGLRVGVVYYYQVSAFNLLGEGPKSEILSIRSNFAPRNCVITPGGFNDCEPHTVTITWSHPSENYSHVGAYRIYSSFSWSPFIPHSSKLVNRANDSLVMEDPGGWGANFYSIAAVYDNGDEIFSNAMGVGHPICEGGCCGSALICGPIIIIILIVTLVVFIALPGKKGKSKR